MLATACDVIELAVMDTVGIDLLVVEASRADEPVRRPRCPRLVSKTRKGGEVAIFIEPARYGARVDREAEAAPDEICAALNGIALVEMAEGFQDHLERIGAALPCGARAE